MSIDIAVKDLSQILLYDGKIEGFSGTFSFDKLIEAVTQKLGAKLANAGGALMCFEVNEKTPLADIQNRMDVIYNLIHKDADIISTININENVGIDSVKFSIVVTGIND